VRLRAMFILATMVLGVMVLSGVALAVTRTCDDNPCVGTNRDDRLIGNDRKNHIYGRGGDDVIVGKQNTDQLYGGRGDDTIRARDGEKDYINCGRGDDTAIVDRDLDTWVNCETVKPDTPPPSPDSVTGTGRLGEEFGSPVLHVNAQGDAGEFSITYPDGTKVQGKIVCLAVNGNEARLVGKVESATGPRAENGTFEKGEYVRIGILDNGIDDKANFSASEPSFTSCTGETPNLEVVRGDFQVKDA
jgi:hemolysin type calcium-binding protein